MVLSSLRRAVYRFAEERQGRRLSTSFCETVDDLKKDNPDWAVRSAVLDAMDEIGKKYPNYKATVLKEL